MSKQGLKGPELLEQDSKQMLRGIRPIRTKTKKGKECKEKVKPLVQVKLQEGRNSPVKESENAGKDKKRRKQKTLPGFAQS